MGEGGYQRTGRNDRKTLVVDCRRCKINTVLPKKKEEMGRRRTPTYALSDLIVLLRLSEELYYWIFTHFDPSQVTNLGREAPRDSRPGEKGRERTEFRDLDRSSLTLLRLPVC